MLDHVALDVRHSAAAKRFAAFVLDPEGNHIEAVCQRPA